MEQGARAFIAQPLLWLPLFVLGIVSMVIACPQLVILGLLGGGWLLRRRAKAHRFDTFVEHMLR